MTPCNATQYGYQMVCKTCDKTWDVNDPYPPECNGGRCRSCGHPAMKMVMNQDDGLCVGCWLAGDNEPKGQSRVGSATEAVANVAIGYGIAVLTQMLVFPLFGLQASTADHIGIAAVFTAVSLVRSYAVRRIFNRLAGRG